MLSSFFNKSKPINFVIVALYMLVLYIIAQYKIGFSLDYIAILLFLAGFVIYVLAMLILNMLTQKNDLTYKSTNTILLFAFLTALLPHALTDFRILVANVFVILGVMNVLNLRNGKQMKATILNASLCIGIASLAYFWSISFILIVFFGVFFFEAKNYRNWIIPIVGVFAVYLLTNCFTLLFYDGFLIITKHVDPMSFSIDGYTDKQHLFSIGIVTICSLFFLVVYATKFSRKSTKSKPVLKLIIAYLLIALTIVIIVPHKNTAELIFITAPLAIIGTTYVELDNGKLIQEINLWVFLLLPFMTLLL